MKKSITADNLPYLKGQLADKVDQSLFEAEIKAALEILEKI